MGRIDIVLSDNIETELRMESTKRLGGRKGDLSKAVEDAIRLWLKNPINEKLKLTATNYDLDSDERIEATSALQRLGNTAITYLIDIANDTRLTQRERKFAMDCLQEILKTAEM